MKMVLQEGKRRKMGATAGLGLALIMAFGNAGSIPQGVAASTDVAGGTAQVTDPELITCPGGQCFADVPAGNSFYEFANRIYEQGIVSGYACGGPGEPCDADSRPYYRPGTEVTRQQMAKFIDNARRMSEINIDTTAARAIYARTTAAGGTAIVGEASSNTIGAAGVMGTSTEFAAIGVLGQAAFAVYGTSTNPNGNGVTGQALGGNAFGVSGNNISGIGVYGNTETGTGVYGISTGSGNAGRFQGNVQVTGNLSKGGGSFKIDHPLDPENKYLYHSFVESPDMMNIYNGNVTLDAKGEATVTMPEWFEALNMEFRYQLTAIGAPGPNLYIARKIAGNTFQIAGGSPNSEVSWQVTGIRHDPYANENRIPVEEDKAPEDRGSYLHPTAWGQLATDGIGYMAPREVGESVP